MLSAKSRKMSWTSFRHPKWRLQWWNIGTPTVQKRPVEYLDDRSSSDLYDLVLEMRWREALQHCKSTPIDASYQDGDNLETPLYLACQNRPPIYLIQELLRAYPEATVTRSRHGDWPLHIACKFNASIEVIAELVRNRPSVVGMSSKWGKTAVQALWESRHTTNQTIQEAHTLDMWKKMQILLEGLAKSRQESEGQTTDTLFLVHAVVSLGSSGCPHPVFEYILQKYPEQVSMKDGKGRLPLHIACGPSQWSHLGARKYKPREQHFISQLLKMYQKGARCLDPNEPTGRYPLHTAIASRHEWGGGVQELFESAPEILHHRDPVTGVLPFQLAAMPTGNTVVNLDSVFQAILANPTVLEEARWSVPATEVPIEVLLKRIRQTGRREQSTWMKQQLPFSAETIDLEGRCSAGFVFFVGAILSYVVLKDNAMMDFFDQGQ